MVEQVFETWSEQVDYEYVVQAFLAKVIDIRDASCGQTSVSAQSRCREGNKSRTTTDENLVRAVLIAELWSVALAWFLSLSDLSFSSQEHVESYKLTNLIATVWLLRMFVPSKITPNDPSPIFLPTR